MGVTGAPARVHVVVLTWDGWDDTEECLDSLRETEYAALRVTVVDNASADDTPLRFERWMDRRGPGACLGIDLVRNEANLGFAEGNNRGVAHALEEGADWVFVLNNDTVVDPAAASELVAEGEGSGAAMVVPAVYDHAHPDRVDRFGIVFTRSGSAYDRISETDGALFCPSGCAALYRRDLVGALTADEGGFFDRRFFMYHEDVDLGFRAWARGYRPAFARGARIHHKGSAALGLGSPRAYYLRHRNAIWTIAKNYSAELILRESPWLVAGQLLGLASAVRRRRFRAVLKGKVEGLLGALRMRRSSGVPHTRTRAALDRRFALTRRARLGDDADVREAGRALRGG